MWADKRVFDRMMHFGISRSSKRTRSSTTIGSPDALRPLFCNTAYWFGSQHYSHKWLDVVFGYSLCFRSGALPPTG